MPNITSCTACGALYEAGNEEQANERDRWCEDCRPLCACGHRAYQHAVGDGCTAARCACGKEEVL